MVPAVDLAVRFSMLYGTRTKSEDESIAVIRRAIELGVSFLDTMDLYGPFLNEKLIGKAIKGVKHPVNSLSQLLQCYFAGTQLSGAVCLLRWSRIEMLMLLMKVVALGVLMDYQQFRFAAKCSL